jgi:predicted aminopeptidase
LLDKPELPAATRDKLESVQRMRAFAVAQLGLPDNGSYRSYADVQREALVWSVIAAPVLSLEPRQWCYPVIGCASYRGYFAGQDAQDYANKLRAEGWDAAVERVPAYSTLGWFADPLPSTVIEWPEPQLAGLIFHELSHQRVYARDDSAFNESYASVVEEEGIRRWLAANQAQGPERERWRETRQRSKQFRALLQQARAELLSLYQSELSEQAKLLAKAERFAQLQVDYAQLKVQWGGFSGYDRWMSRELNNAHLAGMQTYAQWAPALRRLLADLQGDMRAFHARCEELAGLDMEQRRSALLQLQAGA